MIEPDTIASAHPDGFRLTAGTACITASMTFTPDYVFHRGEVGELRITKEGLFYMGALIRDAGQAHSALMDALTTYKPRP